MTWGPTSKFKCQSVFFPVSMETTGSFFSVRSFSSGQFSTSCGTQRGQAGQDDTSGLLFFLFGGNEVDDTESRTFSRVDPSSLLGAFSLFPSGAFPLWEPQAGMSPWRPTMPFKDFLMQCSARTLPLKISGQEVSFLGFPVISN